MDGSNDGAMCTNRCIQTNLHDTDDDELARSWLNLCLLGVASTNAATSAWLQLTCAAIVLHTTQIRMTPSDRAKRRRSVIQSIIQSEQHCRDLLRLSTIAANESSSYGDHEFSMFDAAPVSTSEYGSTQQYGGSSRAKRKRESSLISVMEDGYKTMAASIDKLSMALQGIGEKFAGNKYDVDQNRQIYEALASLGLDEQYKVTCYCYLCGYPSKAAMLVAAPNSIRNKILHDIMTAAEHDK